MQAAIGKVALLFTDLTEAGVDLRMVNLGGGFLTRYQSDVPGIDSFANAIDGRDDASFRQCSAGDTDRAGAVVVGDAGVVAPEVVLV